MTGFIALAAVIIGLEREGFSLEIDSSTEKIDPGASVLLTVSLKTAKGVDVALPDIRDRLSGFSVAEDFEDEPVVGKDGSTVKTVNWKLVPEPVAKTYRIAPFAIGGAVTKAYYFEPPESAKAPEGPIETDPKKDLPPLSLRLLGLGALALAAAAAVFYAVVLLLRYVARRVKEHRMSPIERAWAELDRLVKRGLPGRGRYKDFYVELTMVVRRYVQRRYGVKAPHMTTEEFLSDPRFNSSGELKSFLESADMVKFAGVTATPEMADGATESARTYLKNDSASAEAARKEAVE